MSGKKDNGTEFIIVKYREVLNNIEKKIMEATKQVEYLPIPTEGRQKIGKEILYVANRLQLEGERWLRMK